MMGSSLFIYEKMEKKKNKKRLGKAILIGLGIAGGIYLFKRNRELAGIIKNQENTIDGLMREVKKLSYHLGKKSKI